MPAGPIATQKLRELAVKKEDRETVTKIDSTTIAIVRRWWGGSVKATVRLLCEVADEALTAAREEESEPKA